MNTSQNPSKRRRTIALNPEVLETRQLLTGGAGNTFAIMQGTVLAPNQRVNVSFAINSSLITTPHNQFTLGIDIAKGTNSTIRPRIVGLLDLTTKHMIPVTRTNYTAAVAKLNTTQGPQTTAVQATIRINPKVLTHNYAVVVSGAHGTTGAVLVGFYLPGDTAGGGVVSTSDLNTVKQSLGTQASSVNYSFASDANRNGIIDSTDYRITQKNFGVNVLVSPVVSANLSPSTDTAYPNRTTAFRTVLFTGTATPGATITYTEATHSALTATTVADSKGQYSLKVNLGDGSNTFHVKTTDAFGQSISGSIAPVVYDANVTANIGPDGKPISSTSKPTVPTS